MYAITKQTHHYDGTLGADDREKLIGEAGRQAAMNRFATKAAAQVEIADMETDRHLGHGEYATPTYRVVKVGSRRYEQLYRRTFGD